MQLKSPDSGRGNANAGLGPGAGVCWHSQRPPCAVATHQTKPLHVLLSTDACFATTAASFSNVEAKLEFKLADGRLKFLSRVVLGGSYTGSVGYVDSSWNPTNDGAYTVECTAFDHIFPVAMEGVEVVATIVNSGSSAKGIMFRATAYNVTVAKKRGRDGIPGVFRTCVPISIQCR